jgi:hypothetical protein
MSVRIVETRHDQGHLRRRSSAQMRIVGFLSPGLFHYWLAEVRYVAGDSWALTRQLGEIRGKKFEAALQGRAVCDKEGRHRGSVSSKQRQRRVVS